ncbi:MAG: hypothetical protein DWQ07_15815 [Chloroflexi bacterium]|nr:MAG: hypothetical protein DWQ07_15815 [Chloroflexota bacterium]MBL1195217.1 hypothetical protein [Chloroflexota bacterium]NOH12502.1 hypothetical protein [Chloroflexota bacterium]
MFRKFALILWFTLACSFLPIPSEPTPTEAILPEFSTPTDTVFVPTPTLTDEERCLPSNDELVAFKYPPYGYCLLLPYGYTPHVRPTGVFFIGEAFGSQETGFPALGIFVEESNGRSAEQIARDYRQINFREDTVLIQEIVSIAGQEAVQYSAVEENSAKRMMFFAYQGLAYTITAEPYDENQINSSRLHELVFGLWQHMLTSLKFFEPYEGEPTGDLIDCNLVADIGQARGS